MDLNTPTPLKTPRRGSKKSSLQPNSYRSKRFIAFKNLETSMISAFEAGVDKDEIHDLVDYLAPSNSRKHATFGANASSLNFNASDSNLDSSAQDPNKKLVHQVLEAPASVRSDLSEAKRRIEASSRLLDAEANNLRVLIETTPQDHIDAKSRGKISKKQEDSLKRLLRRQRKREKKISKLRFLQGTQSEDASKTQITNPRAGQPRQKEVKETPKNRNIDDDTLSSTRPLMSFKPPKRPAQKSKRVKDGKGHSTRESASYSPPRTLLRENEVQESRERPLRRRKDVNLKVPDLEDGIMNEYQSFNTEVDGLKSAGHKKWNTENDDKAEGGTKKAGRVVQDSKKGFGRVVDVDTEDEA